MEGIYVDQKYVLALIFANAFQIAKFTKKTLNEIPLYAIVVSIFM